MNRLHPEQAYRQVATQTASRGQLVLMLYDGAIRFLQQATRGFQSEDPLEFNRTVHNNVLRAQEIIRELNLSLDLDRGGECAATLRRLYDYFDWRLQESNVRKQVEGIDEIRQRLSVLREAWAEMMLQQHAPREVAEPVPSLSLRG